MVLTKWRVFLGLTEPHLRGFDRVVDLIMLLDKDSLRTLIVNYAILLIHLIIIYNIKSILFYFNVEF